MAEETINILNVGDKAALKVSSRIYKVIKEDNLITGYLETIKFLDNGKEQEILHTELCKASRPLTEDERKRYEGK